MIYLEHFNLGTDLKDENRVYARSIGAFKYMTSRLFSGEELAAFLLIAGMSNSQTTVLLLTQGATDGGA